MLRKKVKLFSLLLVVTIILFSIPAAVYGEEIIPVPENPTEVSQDAGSGDLQVLPEGDDPGAAYSFEDAGTSGETADPLEIPADPSMPAEEITDSETQASPDGTVPAEDTDTPEETADPETEEQTDGAAPAEETEASEETAGPEDPASSEESATAEESASQEQTEAAEEESTAAAQEGKKASAAKDPDEALLSGVVHLMKASEESNPGQLSLTATKGVYWFAPSIGYPEDDLTDTFIYDDGLLKGDSLNYNNKLATMSYELAVTSISSMREPTTPEGYANKSRNLQAYLEDNGFIDFAVNSDYTEKMTVTSMGVACAHKKITDNGKTYTLLVIAPRSAGYEAEWGSNFLMGATGDHEGFGIAKDHILEFVQQYIEDYGISGDVKVWTSGYSRGAAVVDLLAATLINDSKSLGESVNLTPENLYCYTFGTPRNADVNGDYENPKYLYVHNTFALYDIVTTLPPQDAGFERYGTDTPLIPDDENAKEQMLALLKETNPVVYDVYMNGGDPDSFSPKKIDLEALANLELSLIDDEESYLPDDQETFVRQIVEGSLMDAVGSRANYNQTYEGPMVRFASYFLSDMSGTSDMMGELLESPYAIPAGAAMYMYIIMEKFHGDETISDHNAEIIHSTLKRAFEIVDKLENLDTIIGDRTELKNLLIELRKLNVETIRNILAHPSLLERMQGLTSVLYSQALKDGMEATGASQDDIDQLTSFEDSKAMSRIFAYLLFEDKEQQDNDTDLIKMNSNMVKHAATFLGNGVSYMVPHLNEVIVSWLKVQDEYYDGIEKENQAQTAGYRRLYVEQPEGVDVTGYVKDSSGNVVAVFKNGELISRTNSWISMTTSDNGNWLRLPVDEEYNIDFEISDDTTLTLTVSEYEIYGNKEVRIETSDSKYDWKDLKLRTKDKATLTISSLMPTEDGSFILNSGAAYFLNLLKRFTLTFLLDGGILDKQTGSVSMDVDDGTSIVLPVPTRDGYTFAYWKGSKYYAGDSYTATDDHTFTAIWDKIAEPEEETTEEPATDEEESTDEIVPEEENPEEEDPEEDTDDTEEESLPDEPEEEITASDEPAGIGPAPSIEGETSPETVPNTADSNHLWSYCAALFLSGSLLALLLILHRRKAAEK